MIKNSEKTTLKLKFMCIMGLVFDFNELESEFRLSIDLDSGNETVSMWVWNDKGKVDLSYDESIPRYIKENNIDSVIETLKKISKEGLK